MLQCSNRQQAPLFLPMKDRMMSPQLTISSLFSVLALAGLCLMTGAGGLAGIEAGAATSPFTIQAELSPGLLAN
jgi:hypothetical protein